MVELERLEMLRLRETLLLDETAEKSKLPAPRADSIEGGAQILDQPDRFAERSPDLAAAIDGLMNPSEPFKLLPPMEENDTPAMVGTLNANPERF